MSKKRVSAVVIVMALLFLIFASIVQAGVAPVTAIDTLVAEVNSDSLDEAMAMFAEDAVFTNQLIGRSYVGKEEIETVLGAWQRPGRAFEIVALSMDGDTVEVTLDVSDHGVVWGQQRMRAQVTDGLIGDLALTQIRLSFVPVP
jgi:ketosteroid isomerase-like protein